MVPGAAWADVIVHEKLLFAVHTTLEQRLPTLAKLCARRSHATTVPTNVFPSFLEMELPVDDQCGGRAASAAVDFSSEGVLSGDLVICVPTTWALQAQEFGHRGDQEEVLEWFSGKG